MKFQDFKPLFKIKYKIMYGLSITHWDVHFAKKKKKKALKLDWKKKQKKKKTVIVT